MTSTELVSVFILAKITIVFRILYYRIIINYINSFNFFDESLYVLFYREALLRSCWYKDSETRPKASEIVEFIANNPRLLSPCLDVPLATILMEDSDQMDISGMDAASFRKCSSSISFKNSLPNGLNFDTNLPIKNVDVFSNNESIQLENCVCEPLLHQRHTASVERTDSGFDHDEQELLEPIIPNGNAMSIL